MTQRFDKLVTLLRKLFQLDPPDLDFGFYRVMHAKSAEVIQFLKPVELIAHFLPFTVGLESLLLDYFAGSGTTGHAVINLNREDGGRRKFILVEMGDYFDTVLLPRLKKVTFTPEWKDGKPKRLATPEEAERSPRIMKVLRLESYEDTLNNLELRRTEAQQSLLDLPAAQGTDKLREQYVLRYMLDVEARGSQSLLNIAAFTDPTAAAARRALEGRPQRPLAVPHRDGNHTRRPQDARRLAQAPRWRHPRRRRAGQPGPRYLVRQARLLEQGQRARPDLRERRLQPREPQGTRRHVEGAPHRRGLPPADVRDGRYLMPRVPVGSLTPALSRGSTGEGVAGFHRGTTAHAAAGAVGDPRVGAAQSPVRILIEESQQEIVGKLQELKAPIEAGDLKELDFGNLKTIWFGRHLYGPLLSVNGGTIEISPAPLNEGERRFVEDLKDFYDANPSIFADRHLYLLRNLSKGRGVGFFFFEFGNFHPDFIVWQLVAGCQHVAFIDPKGVRNIPLNDPKIAFREGVKEIEQRLGNPRVSLDSFIVSNTFSHVMRTQWGIEKPEMLRRHSLFQEEDHSTYIGPLLRNAPGSPL